MCVMIQLVHYGFSMCVMDSAYALWIPEKPCLEIELHCRRSYAYPISLTDTYVAHVTKPEANQAWQGAVTKGRTTSPRTP